MELDSRGTSGRFVYVLYTHNALLLASAQLVARQKALAHSIACSVKSTHINRKNAQRVNPVNMTPCSHTCRMSMFEDAPPVARTLVPGTGNKKKNKQNSESWQTFSVRAGCLILFVGSRFNEEEE